nr:MAG TPA: hypothetical protein [Caudoviricetes sp.]
MLKIISDLLLILYSIIYICKPRTFVSMQNI